MPMAPTCAEFSDMPSQVLRFRERERNNLQGFKDFHLKFKALSVPYVPYLADGGV